jgi:tRNA-dihydrouridine synthase B
MLETDSLDRPLGLQLVGSDPDVFARALEIANGFRFDVIDINAACPVNKVVSKGEGSALMREPGKLGSILQTVVKNTELPVTVKIRAGWDENSITAREVALRAEQAGVDAIFIHGRTRNQGYSGRADYNIIREVKKSVRIPVIGSGDAFSAGAVRHMLDETGCDGAAIARGALGNPWIFRDTAELLQNGHVPSRPGIDETADVMESHFELCLGLYGPENGPVFFRKFFVWYTKGFTRVKPLREKAFSAVTAGDIKEVISEFRAGAEMTLQEEV